MGAPDLIYEFKFILISEGTSHWINNEESCLFLVIADCRTSSVFPTEDILLFCAE